MHRRKGAQNELSSRPSHRHDNGVQIIGSEINGLDDPQVVVRVPFHREPFGRNGHGIRKGLEGCGYHPQKRHNQRAPTAKRMWTARRLAFPASVEVFTSTHLLLLVVDPALLNIHLNHGDDQNNDKQNEGLR